MTLRVAAAVAVAVIAIALVAGFLATHRSTSSVPANTSVDQNTASYRALMNRDYAAMNTSTSSPSNHCNSIADTACASSIAAVNPVLQKWIADLAAFSTPPRYVALDAMIRRHLQVVVDVQVVAIQLQKQHNDAGFAQAMNTAVYERAWIDPAAFAVEGKYLRVAATYQGALRLAKQSIGACVGHTPGPADRACNNLINGQPCSGIQAPTCEAYVEDALTQVESYVIAVVQNPSPSRLAARTVAFQSDLVKADDALLAISEAMVAGDSTKAAASQGSFDLYIELALGDAETLLALS